MVVRSADLIQATQGCVLRPLEEQVVHTQQHFVLRVLHGAKTYLALYLLCDLAKMQATRRGLPRPASEF